MVKKKGKSKRITLKDKYKIQRRVVETHRKVRKQAKRDAKSGVIRHDKKKKDPGIPNSWPFKQELLQDIRRSNERIEQQKAEEKERRAQLKDPMSLTAMVAQANQKQMEFNARTGNNVELTNDLMRSNNESQGQQSRRAYLRELKKVIEASDVILQVLDARDPLGTRIHPAIEAGILAHFDKRMVLVMNKIDLIPKSNVSDWLTYLRRSRPAVALKAGTTQSRSGESGKSSGIGQAKGESALTSSMAVGIDGLLQLLKNYARSAGESKKSKSCITVGIIGYPNVGKSSILNSLKRFRSVGVSSRPGFTTSIQEVILDKNIRLLDSPGVVFDDDDDCKSGASAVLRNSIDADSVPDPIPAVQQLLSRATIESLLMTYNIPAFPKDDVMSFLAMVARSKGKVLKGGIPDKCLAARLVLKDWNKGKIPYYSSPPLALDGTDEMDMDGVIVHGREPKVVSSFSEEFDINKILKAHDAELMNELEDKDEFDFVKMTSLPRFSANQNENGIKKVLQYLTKEGDDEDNDDYDATNENVKINMDDDDDDFIKTNTQMEGAEDFDFSH